MTTSHLFNMLDEILASDETKVEGVKVKFAEEVARSLRRKNLSRRQLSEMMSVSEPYVSKVLKGDANLTLKTMVKVCSALGSELSLSILDPSDEILGTDWARLRHGKTHSHKEYECHAQNDARWEKMSLCN